MGSQGVVGDREPVASGWMLEDEPDPQAVQAELERILATPLFRSSRNYPAFLRFVVTRRLERRTEGLKERSLGVEVFGRSPSYDTSADPVVRSTASEVRKRLAAFYQTETRSRVRIELPPGSYIPEFRIPPALPAVPEPELAERRSLPRAYWLGIVLTAIVCVSLAIWRPWSSRPASEVFWEPVLQTPGSILLAFGRPSKPNPNPTPLPGGMSRGVSVPREYVAYSEAYAFGRVAALLGQHQKNFKTQRLGDTTLADLRQGSSVLIGGPWWVSIDWTWRLTDQWRFIFQLDQTKLQIIDRKNPSKKDWSTDIAAPAGNPTKDYALVCRIRDPKTGNFEVVIAGLTGFGTVAAAEFLTDSAQMQQLVRSAPVGWANKNLQVVLSTEIINNNSTAPQIVSQYFW
jgi:hypothetical protein